ncbi:hypothetical protein GCM10011297_30210 [Bacterioplanes sanyensis]|uniref:hypothetical protein n=1 Tax=Bacterioplanes sanyensis TaxID=1249553 RepID=UPI001673D1A1|nr:hypothetical protein [Bacterioplanes sanyensis]GGY55415.1 hypothetical protein GCM10011297_30210 [Bacterioplanes sanyensis]
MDQKTGADIETFTLDGKQYSLDSVSTEAQNLAKQAALTSDFIAKLESRLAMAKTAQSRYLSSLKVEIKKQQA